MLTAAERRIAGAFPSFRTFVDAALFDPRWGHYSTGRIRFGEGGHYDTFPLALSPVFGQMLAGAAFRLWQRTERPPAFDVCEIGAGNGQLCLDTLVAVTGRPRAGHGWQRFAAALRYRIVERSPALVARQRAQLGPLAARVRWTRADLSVRSAPGVPFGDVGLVIANEVLDCLAHHKIVRGRDGEARVAFVVPTLRAGSASRAMPRRALGRILAGSRKGLAFREVALPLAAVPRLEAFLARHCPELLHGRRPWPPYFACPEVVPLMENVGRLYRRAEMLWIDYGGLRAFHRRTPAVRRVFAGPPRSRRTVYDAPGADDITFMVDFSVVAKAAREKGLEVVYYGGQGALAAVSGVRLDRAAVDLIARYRALGWALSTIGLGPERRWRRGGLTWGERGGKGGRLGTGVARDVAEFLGRRRSHFRLMVLATPALASCLGRRWAVPLGRSA